MSAAEKLAIVQTLLLLYAERYIHVDDAQALLDCKTRDYVNAFTAIMHVLDDYVESGEDKAC